MKIKRMHLTGLFGVFFLLLCWHLWGSNHQVSRAETVLAEVWDTVATHHYDRNFKKTHRKLYEHYKPEILRSKNDSELGDAINRLLKSTGDSHMALLVPLRSSGQLALRALQAQRTDKVLDMGFSILDNGSELLVSEVTRPDSPLRMGDVLLELDGIRINRHEPMHPSWGIVIRALMHGGLEKSEATVKVRHGTELKICKVKRLAGDGGFFQLGAMPRMAITYRSFLRPDNIGVISFNMFVPDIIKKVRRDVRKKFKNAAGLIIDLRGNPGGILLTAEWLGAWCVPRPVPMGVMVLDGNRVETVSEPQRGVFKGALAVLTDRDSCSTSEVFAAALQDARAATVVGEKTPGLCLPSQVVNLKCNFRLQLVAGEISRAGGGRIEGVGVVPDVPVLLTADGLRGGKDPVMEKAAEILKKTGKKPEKNL